MLPDLYNIFVYLLKYNEAVYTLAPKSEDNKMQSQIFKILNASKRQKLYLVTGKIGEMKKHSVKFKHQKKELIVKLREDIIIHCLPSNIITVYLLAKGPAAVVPKQTKEWELTSLREGERCKKDRTRAVIFKGRDCLEEI